VLLAKNFTDEGLGTDKLAKIQRQSLGSYIEMAVWCFHVLKFALFKGSFPVFLLNYHDQSIFPLEA
jgi:hypothetical protein